MAWFRKSKKKAAQAAESREELWIQCPSCDAHVYVAVDDQRNGFVQQEGRDGGDGVQKSGTGLLAAEPASNAFGAHNDTV